jgi:predicted acylesterase/phospholipase RssA
MFSSVEDSVNYSPFSIVVDCSVGAAVAAAAAVAADDPEVLVANLLAAYGNKV